MASWKEHGEDCTRLLGDPCMEVHKWLDELAAKVGPVHRCVRHHTRGVSECGRLFGEIGQKAAVIHILKDMGHVPTVRDWADQVVDTLGIPVEISKGQILINSSGAFLGYESEYQFDKYCKYQLAKMFGSHA